MPMLTRIGTPRFRRWVVERIPSKDVQHLRGIIDTLWRTSTEIIDKKKKALAEGDEAVAAQIGRGKDVISILSERAQTFSIFHPMPMQSCTVKGNTHASESERLSEEELVGQVTCVLFSFCQSSRLLICPSKHPNLCRNRYDVKRSFSHALFVGSTQRCSR